VGSGSDCYTYTMAIIIPKSKEQDALTKTLADLKKTMLNVQMDRQKFVDKLNVEKTKALFERESKILESLQKRVRGNLKAEVRGEVKEISKDSAEYKMHIRHEKERQALVQTKIFNKKLADFETRVKANNSTKGIMSVVPKRFPKSILAGGRYLKPVGASRQPLMGVGLTTYMKKNKINNPVLVAKAYKKKPKDLAIYGFINLRSVCEQMNVNAQEAFLYICEGMTSNNTRWLNHKVIKEHTRGALGVVNLVNYYDEKVMQNRSANKFKFTVKQLYHSEYYLSWCQEYDVKKMSYTDFTKTFNKFKKLAKEYKEKSKSLLAK